MIDGGSGDGDGTLPPDDSDAPHSWMTDPNAIAEWQQIIPELRLRKQYIRLFGTEVARYCVAFGHYVAAVEAMAQSDPYLRRMSRILNRHVVLA